MLREQTIRIRIGGIDAPEVGGSLPFRPVSLFRILLYDTQGRRLRGRFQALPGLEPQPGAKQSLKWLTRQVEGKFVYCQFYERDIYGRIVSVLPREDVGRGPS